MAEQLTLGDYLKEEGIRRTLANADPEWSIAFDQALQQLIEAGTSFTSEDVTALCGQPDHPNRVGAKMFAASRKGLIERVGFEPAKRPNQHSTLISVWRGK